MPRLPAFGFPPLRLRLDRQGGALIGWAFAGALVAGLVVWSVALAERESRAHTIVQAAW
ncbi:MAG: hypothetical protein SGJ23_17595 [Alphaproteobacteria bacterium]|nr:hypothetical protein [Alphaproteobacteria bacterium]